ncbi:stalk domain-containing protein [Paenibacillus sp. VTT E-133280]|uniref:stalk domain-containing protein n=1 Tax=Paenibacillus sp. VTT E-133280 TaxID=1986222 RepID=UPI00117E26A5|nr:stalk domain-containing protein [Paenibacillus sp. VTT E-133280]
MKNWGYMLSGVVIGAVLMVSSSAFADQIQSFVGKTVAGEYTVNVNGKDLSEKAIVVNNKAHVPLRAVSDSLGATIKVEGKTIVVTSGNNDGVQTEKSNTSDKSLNPYVGQTKESLEESKNILMTKVIEPSKQQVAILEKRLAAAEVSVVEGEKAMKYAEENNSSETEKQDASKSKNLAASSVERTKLELDSLKTDLNKYEQQLSQINEALSLIN